MLHDRSIAVPAPQWAGMLLLSGIVFCSLWNASRCVAAEREVLIWYVNETAPVEEDLRNYETIIGWLESGDTEKAQTFATTLREEMTLFREAVDREQAAIEAGTNAADGRLETMIITNRLARAGMYRFFDRSTGQFAEARFETPAATADYVLDSNPLVRRETLAAALAEAARRYDPGQHRFVLITKSHGGPRHALTVRLPRHHEDITREQLLASLAGNAVDVPPPPEVGITKSEYFEVLDEAGSRYGMRFSLVFMEACQGIFEPGEEQDLPSNVELLYTSGNRSLQYSTLDYPALFLETSSGATLTQSLDAFLEPRYMALFRARPPAWRRWIWFTPLLAVGLWYLARTWHKRRPPADTSGASVATEQ